MISRQTSISKSSNISRLELRVKLDYTSRCGLEVFGVSAIGIDSRERRVLAMNIISEATGSAKAAGYERV